MQRPCVAKDKITRADTGSANRDILRPSDSVRLPRVVRPEVGRKQGLSGAGVWTGARKAVWWAVGKVRRGACH